MHTRRPSRGVLLTLASGVLAVIVVASTGLVSTASASGGLCGDSCCIRVFSIDGGSASSEGLSSPSFQAEGTIGDLGEVHHASASFQLLAGFVAQKSWLRGGTVVAALTPELVVRTALAQPRPNPSTHATKVSFAIADGEMGGLRVYDVSGRQVRVLEEDLAGPASAMVRWDNLDDRGRAVAPGIYFVRLASNERTLTRKVVITR